MSGGGYFKDEQGSRSMARALTVAWLTHAAIYVWLRPHEGQAITFNAGVASLLICWAAGPRIAQYLAPQLGKVVASIKDAILARRDADDGTERTP